MKFLLIVVYYSITGVVNTEEMTYYDVDTCRVAADIIEPMRLVKAVCIPLGPNSKVANTPHIEM